ncbi:MAG TPA: hypothetical protein VNI01_00370 [Elusimicrobiota bacterium]|nr:hypothetical protein [Elusimicrobiota bacterium]
MRSLALAAILLCPGRAFAADPLAAEIAAMAKDGYGAPTRAQGAGFIAAVYDHGGDYQSLRIYHVAQGRAKMVYLEPTFSAKMALASIHDGGALPDLAKDGSRILAYSVTFRGTGEEALVVLKARGGKLQRVGRYPFGEFRDLDRDGRPEVVSRDRPLGQFFSLECQSFRTMAQTAFRPRVYAWRGGTLVNASAEFPRFFSEKVAALSAGLERADARSSGDYGGFLGDALSVFFAERELGRGRDAWREFQGRFQVRATDPPGTRRCLAEMDSKLRATLAIPSDW